MLKRCLLHDGKMVVEYKALMFSILHKPLISREFAYEESPRANTRWIFGVEQKTQTEKPRDTENL